MWKHRLEGYHRRRSPAKRRTPGVQRVKRLYAYKSSPLHTKAAQSEVSVSAISTTRRIIASGNSVIPIIFLPHYIACLGPPPSPPNDLLSLRRDNTIVSYDSSCEPCSLKHAKVPPHTCVPMTACVRAGPPPLGTLRQISQGLPPHPAEVRPRVIACRSRLSMTLLKTTRYT